MTEASLENTGSRNELINEEVLRDETVLAYRELVDGFVDNQEEIGELIDPESGEEERERYVRLIKDDVFIDSLSAIAGMGLDSDESGIIDSADIDDTLLSLEEASPSILDLFIGTAYAETISRKKLEKAGESLAEVKVLIEDDGKIDYEESRKFAETLFNVEELKEEDRPILYAFTSIMIRTLHEYKAQSNPEPTVEEVLRALRNLMEITYGWPWLQRYDEKQLESYPTAGAEDKERRSDSVVLAEFFVDVMYKSMEASGENEEAFEHYLVRLWEVFGLSKDEKLMSEFASILNIDGARSGRLEEARAERFEETKKSLINVMADNDLKYEKDVVRSALSECRKYLSVTDRAKFDLMFINGNFEKDFATVGGIQMRKSVKEIMSDWKDKAKEAGIEAAFRATEGTTRVAVGAVGELIENQFSEEKTLSALFAELGLTEPNLSAAYSAAGTNGESDSMNYSLPEFTTSDIAKYLWRNKDKKPHVREAFRQYALRVQQDIDRTREVEKTDRWENISNILSALAIGLSDKLTTKAGYFGVIPILAEDIASATERFKTWRESDTEGFGYFGANLLDYSMHNMNLLPYLTWMGTEKWAGLGRHLISPGIGALGRIKSVPVLTGIVGLKIIIADVIFDIHIDDETGKISFGLPLGDAEPHSRNVNEDIKETITGIIYILISFVGADRIKNLPSTLKWLGKPFGLVFRDNLISDMNLDRGEFKKSGDKDPEPKGKKLSPEQIRSGIEGVSAIEPLKTEVQYRGKTFTHRSVIMQCVKCNGAPAKRVVIRMFNMKTGDYFDIEYIIDEKNVRSRSSVGEVHNMEGIKERVGRLRRTRNPLDSSNPMGDFEERYNRLRGEVMSGEGNKGKGKVDIPGIENKVQITSEAVQEALNARGEVKAILDGFGEGHVTPVIEDMDFAELRKKYPSMSKVISETEPKSYKGEMFNRKVILVRDLGDGKLEVTIRLFQDERALGAGSQWDRVRVLWTDEKYLDIKYAVKNGAVEGNVNPGKWTSVRELGVGDASAWLADYSTTQRLVAPAETYLENLDALRTVDPKREIHISVGQKEYLRTLKIDGESKKFKIISRSEAGEISFEIHLEEGSGFRQIYKQAVPRGSRILALLHNITEGKPVINGGLFTNEGMPLVLSDPEEIERLKLYGELDDFVRTAEDRTRGMIRALDTAIPIKVTDDFRVINFTADILGPEKEPSPTSLERRISRRNPKISDIIKLKYPLKTDRGTFTHAISMSFEDHDVLADGEDIPRKCNIREEILFDLKKNLVRREVSFTPTDSIGISIERAVTHTTENARMLMDDYLHLAEYIGADADLSSSLSCLDGRWAEEVRFGERRTTLNNWVGIEKDMITSYADTLLESGKRKLPEWVKKLLKLHIDEKGQCDPVELVRGMIEFFVERPANAMYGPETPVGKFLGKLSTDLAFRRQFFNDMQVRFTEGLTPKMNAIEGIGAVMMVVFAISMGVQRQSALSAEEAGTSAAPAMVGFGAGMVAGGVAEAMIGSLSFVKAAPGLWGKAIAVAGGFVVGMTAGMWAHHALGVPLEKRHPMFAHYVGAGGEILFSGGGVTDLLVMGATNNTDDIYVWMNESVPGIEFNFKDPSKRWVDINNMRLHPHIHRDWTLVWNNEVDSAIKNREDRIDMVRSQLEAWKKDPLLQMQLPEGDKRYEEKIAKFEKEIEELEAKKITDENAWRDNQLVELIYARDQLDQGRVIAKAHLRMATIPSRAISYIHKLGEQYLPSNLYDKITDFEDRVMPEAMRDGDSNVLELLSEKLYGYRVMATAILIPHVNAVEFYKGGFGGAELHGREKEEVSRFDADELVSSEAIFLEQPADEPYFSREKGLEGSIMETPGAKELERVAKITTKDGRLALSRSVAEYIMMQDSLASRVTTLEAYELLPPNWQEKAEELRREKRIEELPEELQFLISLLEEVDKDAKLEEDLDSEL